MNGSGSAEFPAAPVQRRQGKLWSPLALIGVLIWSPSHCPASGAVAESSPAEALAANVGNEATALMREVEAAFRSGPRLVRLEVSTVRDDTEQVFGRPDSIDLWGVLNGHTERTDMLFVFAHPDWMRGTGLLLSDPWDPLAEDGFHYHMPSFNRFKRLPQSSLKLLVAGTSISYEDAHGFLSTDKYDFTWNLSEGETDGEALVSSCPKSPELSENLGYRRLEVAVDTDRKIVRRIEYIGLNDQLMKIYEVRDQVRVGKTWLPSAARVEDVRNLVVSEIKWTYWPIERRPPDELYETRVQKQRLIDRFIDHIEALGADGFLDENLAPLRLGADSRSEP